ncbi:hypothetical protein F4782DRAFT_552838 [Xylaria castorea]|nr:hypothetical protein F4782DRAFT_552838 [Xylaria castorea]
MTELISLADLLPILPSIDPIYIGPSAPLALPAAGIRAILRRTKSMGCHSNLQDFQRTAVSSQNDEHVEYARGRTKSPARATIEIFHLVAYLALVPNLEKHPAREALQGVEPEYVMLRRILAIQDEKKIDNTTREATLRDHENISSYITKGAFRLCNHRGPELFRFPKSRSQPEPSWRVGDGFSDDEATPDFAFLATGKHKRKRSRSPSAFGQLSIEAENIVGNSVEGATSSQSCLRRLHRPRGKAPNAELKEVWPIRENFAESTINQKRRYIAIKSHGSTLRLNLERTAVPNQDVKRTIPLKRMASGFENLGKGKRRSQSNHRRNPSFSFPRLMPEYEDQAGDGEYDEEEDGPYEQKENESEQGSDFFEYTYTPEELEGIGSGSEKPGEDNADDLDEDMQDTVSDSQTDEVPSSSRDLGQRVIRTARARIMARWASSHLNSGVN